MDVHEVDFRPKYTEAIRFHSKHTVPSITILGREPETPQEKAFVAMLMENDLPFDRAFYFTIVPQDQDVDPATRMRLMTRAVVLSSNQDWPGALHSNSVYLGDTLYHASKMCDYGMENEAFLYALIGLRQQLYEPIGNLEEKDYVNLVRVIDYHTFNSQRSSTARKAMALMRRMIPIEILQENAHETVHERFIAPSLTAMRNFAEFQLQPLDADHLQWIRELVHHWPSRRVLQVVHDINSWISNEENGQQQRIIETLKEIPDPPPPPPEDFFSPKTRQHLVDLGVVPVLNQLIAHISGYYDRLQDLAPDIVCLLEDVRENILSSVALDITMAIGELQEGKPERLLWHAGRWNRALFGHAWSKKVDPDDATDTVMLRSLVNDMYQYALTDYIAFHPPFTKAEHLRDALRIVMSAVTVGYLDGEIGDAATILERLPSASRHRKFSLSDLYTMSYALKDFRNQLRTKWNDFFNALRPCMRDGLPFLVWGPKAIDEPFIYDAVVRYEKSTFWYQTLEPLLDMVTGRVDSAIKSISGEYQEAVIPRPATRSEQTAFEFWKNTIGRRYHDRRRAQTYVAKDGAHIMVVDIIPFTTTADMEGVYVFLNGNLVDDPFSVLQTACAKEAVRAAVHSFEGD